MPDCMEFPTNWKDFLASHSFIDHEKIYTNGSELISCFRVEQLIEHYFPEENKEHCYTCDDLEKNDSLYSCRYDDVGYCFDEIRNIQYCPKCGRRLLTYEEKDKRAEATMRKLCKQILAETEGD